MPLTLTNTNGNGGFNLRNNSNSGRLSATVTPAVIVGDAIRASLSTSVASYDSASVGNWVKVTAAEYANVKATVANVITYGMTEAQANENSSAWTGTCAHTLPQSLVTSPPGEYIIGFSARLFNVNGTITILTSTSYKGTYSSIGNSPSMNFGSREYFVRKAPTTANAATTYVASVTSTNRVLGSTNFANSGYDCASPYDTWTLWNTAAPIFQFIGTSTKSW